MVATTFHVQMPPVFMIISHFGDDNNVLSTDNTYSQVVVTIAAIRLNITHMIKCGHKASFNYLQYVIPVDTSNTYHLMTPVFFLLYYDILTLVAICFM